MASPTTEQFSSYQVMFDHFNRELFEGLLPHVILNFSRDRKRAVGYYAAERWHSDEGHVDEITLNPDHLQRGPRATAATLVHEMVHLWQQTFGKPSRTGYHNREWADKMESIGLIPSNTGEPGGRRVGQRMTHYVQPNGAFVRSFQALSLSLPWESEARWLATTSSAKDKAKYTCPNCGVNVWGKPGLQLACLACMVLLTASFGKEKEQAAAMRGRSIL